MVTELTTQTEEKPSRVRSYEEDRDRITEKLQFCIDPADLPDRVINIVTGTLGPKKVNVTIIS